MSIPDEQLGEVPPEYADLLTTSQLRRWQKENGLVLVRNLATGERKFFACAPEQAVIAAHAQARHDGNTWRYQERYGKEVQRGRETICCGDWCALSPEEEE